jgi:hypothetical protein
MLANSQPANRFFASMGGGPSFPMLPLPSTNILANMDDGLMGLLPYDAYQPLMAKPTFNPFVYAQLPDDDIGLLPLLAPFASFQDQTKGSSIYDVVPGEYRTEEICTDAEGNMVPKGTPGAVCSQMKVRDSGLFDRPQLPNLPSLDEALENMRQKLIGGLTVVGLIAVGIIVLVLVIKR